MTSRTSLYIWLLFLLILPAQGVSAQFSIEPQVVLGLDEIKGPEDVVSWTSRAVPSTIGPRGVSVIKLTARMNGDWKMYALDSTLPSRDDVLSRPYGVVVTLSNVDDALEALGDVGQSPPEVGYDITFDMELGYFHTQATFYAGVRAVDSLAATHEFFADVRYQVCSDDFGICLRPATISLPVTLFVDPTCSGCSATEADISHTRETSAEGGAMMASLTSDLESYREGGMLPFLLLAIAAGLISLLTPCVFPMIPLTISYFTKQGHSRSKAVRMALVFGAAIVVTFTGIGVVMSVLVGAAGAQTIASNPWVNLMIAAVLIGFALSLLGLYELRLPSSFLTRVGKRGTEERGWAGVLFMGLTLTLVSFSCTAPFVGGLLAAASAGTWIYPLFGMIVYSTTFALPFVLLALFPRALESLPRSGAWMNSLKVVLGFIELAAAVKFLSNADLVWGFGLLSRTLGIAFVLVIFLMTGLYLLGKLRFPHEPVVESIGVGRLLAAGGFFVFSLYLIPGLLGAPLNALDAYLPPRLGTDVSIYSLIGADSGQLVDPEEGWFVDDIDGAFAEATSLERPVLVDFSGWTCTNCREMEANVFPLPEVASLFREEFVALRLYTDDLEMGDEFHEFQMGLTGSPALPTFAIVAPQGRVLLARESALMDKDEFLEFLNGGLEEFRSSRD